MPIVRAVRPLLLLAFLAACKSSDTTTVHNTTFSATLSPANETPAVVGSQASGTAQFVFDGTSLAATLSIQNMDSVTAAHIHVGAAGVAGPIVLALFTGPVVAQVGASQTLVSQSFTAANINGISGAPPISMDSLVALMRSGAAYVNVHTRKHPAGEIRGQVSLQQ